MTPKPDFPWMKERMFKVVGAAEVDDLESIDDVLDQIGDRFGDRGVYTLACMLASCLGVFGQYEINPPDSFYGFEIIDTVTGKRLDPAKVEGLRNQAITSGMRFLTAFINDDQKQMLALFHTDDAIIGGLCLMAGAASRHYKQRNAS